jgi:phage baseplate assembly protein W
MASVLKRFNKSARGTEETDIDFIANISPTGDFQRVTDINTILNSWNNILITPKGTYPYDPEYGSDLYKLIFEPLDDETAQQIEREVVYTLQTYDNRASLEDITISYLRGQKGFALDLAVNYKGETGNLSVVLTERLFSGFLTVGD